jgi:hypothetical protein
VERIHLPEGDVFIEVAALPGRVGRGIFAISMEFFNLSARGLDYEVVLRPIESSSELPLYREGPYDVSVAQQVLVEWRAQLEHLGLDTFVARKKRGEDLDL